VTMRSTGADRAPDSRADDRSTANEHALPFPPRTGAGGIPRILTTLIERLDEYLRDPDACLPSLNRANGRERQQRLDRRIACVQLLRAQVKYLDLVSLRIGVPQSDGRFLSLTLPFLAKQAGIGLRRAERAMRDLEAAGLVTSQQRCEKTDDGGFRGLASLRQLPAALFGAFGLAKWLRHERSKASLRRHLAANARSKTARADRDERDSREHAQGSLFLGALKHRVNQMRQAFSGRRKASASAAHDADFERQVMLRATALWIATPGLGRDACYAQARAELSGSPAPFTSA
jgi:hypothetical protein